MDAIRAADETCSAYGRVAARTGLRHCRLRLYSFPNRAFKTKGVLTVNIRAIMRKSARTDLAQCIVQDDADDADVCATVASAADAAARLTLLRKLHAYAWCVRK